MATESEVKPYLKRLIGLILIGVVVMAATAIWAWKRYGAKLDQAPALPSGTPALTQPAPPPSP